MSNKGNSSTEVQWVRPSAAGESDAWTHDLLGAVAVVITDSGRRVRGWNRRAALRYGYLAETVFGQDLLSVPPFDDPDGLGAVARERLEREANRERVSAHTFMPLDHAPKDVHAIEGESVIVMVHEDPADVPQDEGFLGRQLGREWALLEAVLKQLPVGLSVTEAPDGRHLVRNTRAVRLLGSTRDSTLPEAGREASGIERLDGTPYRAEELPLARALAGETIHQEDIVYRRADGNQVYFAVNAAPIWGEDGVMRAAVATFDDVSERKAMEAALRANEEELKRVNERLLHDALHDVLTGLPNRTLLLDRLGQVLHRRQTEADRDAALLFLDLDHFKIVNDSLGHAAGDAMLVAIARTLQHVVRPEDTVARLGGDEFVVLMDHLASPNHAVDLAQRIAAAFEHPLDLDGHHIYTSASIGILPTMRSYEHSEDVLRDADTAMYRAKESGRGRHKLFDQTMRNDALAAMDLENGLRKALAEDQFRVHYGPIHRLDTREVVGFEALVRWEHPERGILPASEFLPTATEMGIGRPIDRRVWREAVRTVETWRATSGRRLLLSLNFNARHFLSPVPEAALLDTLREGNATMDQTVLKLPEGALAEASDETSDALLKIVAQGIGLHLDDFGSAHFSLASLQRFNVTTLKLTHDLISSMVSDPKSAELVRTMITMAATLGLDVIAKGVQTEAQRDFLLELGCTYAQGRLFSRPVAAEGAARLLQGVNSRSDIRGLRRHGRRRRGRS